MLSYPKMMDRTVCINIGNAKLSRSPAMRNWFVPLYDAFLAQQVVNVVAIFKAVLLH